MEIRIDFTLSAQQNADNYYKRSKKLMAKKEGAEKAIEELSKRLAEEREKSSNEEKRKLVVTRQKEWYEKFHWFFTSDSLLAIGGRDAHQNELINSRYFEDNDLFFHADIFGASAVVLKNGTNASQNAKEEAAQFAACFSSAWERMLSSVDVYALKKEQVTKSTNKGSLGTGSFLLKGEREWFKGAKLQLVAFVEKERFCIYPRSSFERVGFKGAYVEVSQGNIKKSDAAKRLSSFLGYENIDDIMRSLPAGTFSLVQHNA
ncbi:MAG: NFACT RNA binding domain-containing protein [Candidatus Micrarchaeia archaeon]